MTRIVQQVGRSPFPLITHFTSHICGVPAPTEQSGRAHDQQTLKAQKDTNDVKRRAP